MKKLSFRVKGEYKNQMLNMLSSSQFYMSNPDQTSGESLDVIIKGNQLLYGFDLLLLDQPKLTINTEHKVKITEKYIKNLVDNGRSN